MKVLVLSRMFPNTSDPANGVFVLEQIRALRRLGVSITVLAPRPWLPPFSSLLTRYRKYMSIAPREVVDGFDVERPSVPVLPKSRLFPAYGLLTYMRCRRNLRQHLCRSRIDLIHAHAVLPDGLAAVLLGREFHIPVLCTVHGSDISDYPFRNRAALMATKWTIDRVNRLIAVNNDLASRIVALGGFRPVTVAYNGADQQVFSPEPPAAARAKLGLPVSTNLVVFVGYLCPEKGLEYLLAAMKQLIGRDTLLYFVGDGVLHDSLQAEATRLGVGERCIFVGKRPHSEISLWLSAADCCVLPSITEGFPLVIVEAMFCHTPVVATSVGGVPEIVRDGDTGLLVPPRDPTRLASALDRVLSDRDFASALAHRAARMATGRFTWAHNAEHTLAAYTETLAEAGGNGKCSHSAIEAA